MAQHREGPAREPVGGKRVSGASGDGCSADLGGERPREDENQEGIGLIAYSKRWQSGTDSRRGEALKAAYPFPREAS